MTGYDKQRIVGVLLAGGQSRRMFRHGPSADANPAAAPPVAAAGGEPAPAGDKGLLDLGGKPMLGHVVDRLRPQVGRMVINANGDPTRFAAFGLPVIADTVGGFAGPLSGVLAAMRWTAQHQSGARDIVTVSTDAPFLPRDLVARLVEARLAEPPGGIALAASGGELHPVIGLWPVDLADDLEAALNQGTRKVLAWTDRHGTIPVDFPFERIGETCVDPFFNANTPDELAEARRLVAVMS
jgi:molybdopterin-guanine dinucleotide biosynthesis protein A